MECLGEREGDDVGVEDGVEVGDCVEDGDVKGEGCDDTDDELGEDTFRDVSLGVWNFFCDYLHVSYRGPASEKARPTMSASIWCANCESSIEHAG